MSLAMSLAVSGCVTRPLIPPAGCDLIDDVPGLRDEMRTLRLADDVRQQLQLAPTTARVRAYARAASVKCAYDREIGARRISPDPAPVPWWRRWLGWLTGRRG